MLELALQLANLFIRMSLQALRAERLTASIEGFGAESESQTDMSYGVGADIGSSDTFLVNVEYMNWFDKDGTEISGLSLGFTRKF